MSIMELWYHVVAIESIEEGEEVLIQYGRRNNRFLLEGYGFVEKGNPYDSLVCYFGDKSEAVWFDRITAQHHNQEFKFKINCFNL